MKILAAADLPEIHCDTAYLIVDLIARPRVGLECLAVDDADASGSPHCRSVSEFTD
ncbi:hypothetical protein [Nocardia alba]|uniref:hypothetical protein n=1 Tax=Nocardia alba TaxID=225051 RepID=UPI000A9EE9CD|nr:hypothetical protein [Nocardia alba]